MKRTIIATATLFTSCAGAGPLARDVIDAREAICRVIKHQNSSDPQISELQALCDSDAELKEIAARYAGTSCEKPAETAKEAQQ